MFLNPMLQIVFTRAFVYLGHINILKLYQPMHLYVAAASSFSFSDAQLDTRTGD